MPERIDRPDSGLRLSPAESRTAEGGESPAGPAARSGADRPRAAPAPTAPVREDRTGRVFDSLNPGILIGDKYRLVECLGEGGMATVWVAHNEALDIEVAIKFIRTDVNSPNLAERLLQEARAAAKLRHPAIVRVFDFGQTPRGDPYIVMERLDGNDLASVYFAAGRMTGVAAVRTLLPIAHALAVAHDKGIVHRDLKPDNIFLARVEDGQLQPKLLDFGVAKHDAPAVERLTQAGTAVGSPAYMSPEQARGEDVDARSDVWSFTVVLYEALSGVLPFRDQNYNALMRQIIEQDPTPITSLAAGDVALWSIVERGLAKRRDERWSSMRAIGAALARWLIDHDVHEDVSGASLVATWLQARQSWVDSDGVFERVTDSGPHSTVRTVGGQFTSEAATQYPPPHAGSSPHRVVESRAGAATVPSLPAPRRHLKRKAGLAVAGAIGAAAAVTLALGLGRPTAAPGAAATSPASASVSPGASLAPVEPPPLTVPPSLASAPSPNRSASPPPVQSRAPSPAHRTPPASSAPAARPAPAKAPKPPSGKLEVKTTF